MNEVVNRLLDWFEDAAANRFDARTALFHAIGVEPASSPRATRRGRSMSREKTLALSPYSESFAMAMASASELKVCTKCRRSRVPG
jgi:hypothetical protein